MTVTTGEVVVARVMGDIEMISEKGEKFKLLNILYLPSVKRNQLSTNRFTQKGPESFANNERIPIKKEKFEISLPAIGNYNKMYCLRVQRIGNEAHDVASELEKIDIPTGRKAVKEMARLMACVILERSCYV